MKKFKVTAPKGFQFGGKLLKEGETFEAENKSAHVQTGLHFKQIEEAGEEAPEKPAKESAKESAK